MIRALRVSLDVQAFSPYFLTQLLLSREVFHQVGADNWRSIRGCLLTC